MEIATSVEPSAIRSNIEWGPILGGAAIATATGVILLTFGTAVGLTVTSPYDGEGLSPVAFAVGAGLYFLWVQVMAFFMGGYVTGRLKGQAPGATEHEVDVRDGLHGLVMWGVAILAAGFIAVVGLGGVGAAAHAPQNDLSASVGRVVDRQVDQSAAREQQLDVAPSDATTAERKADIARKLTIISAFVTAASLLIGAVAAFYGAHSGGNHRDKNTHWEFFHSRARVITVKPVGQ